MWLFSIVALQIYSPAIADICPYVLTPAQSDLKRAYRVPFYPFSRRDFIVSKRFAEGRHDFGKASTRSAVMQDGAPENIRFASCGAASGEIRESGWFLKFTQFISGAPAVGSMTGGSCGLVNLLSAGFSLFDICFWSVLLPGVGNGEMESGHLVSSIPPTAGLQICSLPEISANPSPRISG